MPASSAPRAPGLRALHLPELDEAERADVGPGQGLSALLVTAAAAADRSLAGARCSEVLVRGGGFGDIDCRAARFLETRFEAVSADRLLASGSTWRASELQQCRFGALELDNAVLASVALAGGKCHSLNLAGAQLSDVLVDGCDIGECDLSSAVAQRVAFPEARIGTLTVTGARLQDVDLRGARIERVIGIGDLRGAVITDGQLSGLAPSLAEHLGIGVAEAE
jgi:uncharacterized protein YjbI with pentapeptide repeats